MNNLVTLYNVVDIRTRKFHSMVIVDKRFAKWFVPAEDAEQE